MPIIVFCNSSFSYDNGIKTDTSIFVQKFYLSNNYIEANIEKDIHLKNQYKIKTLPDPISIREACSKNFVVNKLDDPSIMKNAAHFDFNDKNLDKLAFIKVNSFTNPEEHQTPKIYADRVISDGVDESSLLRL